MPLLWGRRILIECKLEAFKNTLKKFKPRKYKSKRKIKKDILKQRKNFDLDITNKQLIEYLVEEEYKNQHYLIEYDKNKERMLKEDISKMKEYLNYY